MATLFNFPKAKDIIESGNLSEHEVMLGLSGGINSMAVLCWLSLLPAECKPKKVHIFYAHFAEHSPDTFQFVADGIRFARKHFKEVAVKITSNSVLKFFEGKNMIPHPKFAPCTEQLKQLPMFEYMVQHQLTIDLIGYVREESKRYTKMTEHDPQTDDYKAFPIIGKSNEWCFEIVTTMIGWYPAIYDIRDAKGRRVFSHNNCLPCKNMHYAQMENVRTYFLPYHTRAMQTSKRIKRHWGRDAVEFYTKFGREDFEVDYQEQVCETCAFD